MGKWAKLVQRFFGVRRKKLGNMASVLACKIRCAQKWRCEGIGFGMEAAVWWTKTVICPQRGGRRDNGAH